MDTCPSVVVDYFTYTPFHLLEWTQLLLSTASIFVVVYSFFAYLRKSWFEGPFKETIHALYFALLWHSAFTAILQSIQIITRLLARTPCEMMFDRRICVLRVVITLAFPSFVWIHAAIAIQRIVTSYTGNLRVHKYVARSCLIVTLAYCVGYVLVGKLRYPLEGNTCYCSGFANGSERSSKYESPSLQFTHSLTRQMDEKVWEMKRRLHEILHHSDTMWKAILLASMMIVIGTFIMMTMDGLNVAVGLFLIWYNHKKIGEKRSASLATKFRYRQTLRSTQQMLPVAIFHLLCFTAQYVGFEISTKLKWPEVPKVTINGFLYTMPYYCLLCPTILLLIMMREERRKKRELSRLSATTSEAASTGYFLALQEQWRNNSP